MEPPVRTFDLYGLSPVPHEKDYVVPYLLCRKFLDVFVTLNLINKGDGWRKAIGMLSWKATHSFNGKMDR